MTDTIEANKLERLIHKNAKNNVWRLNGMTTTSKLKIKVIKKDAVEFYKTSNAVEKKTKQNTTSQVTANVLGWINEFHNRQREDSIQAFNQLFSLQN